MKRQYIARMNVSLIGANQTFVLEQFLSSLRKSCAAVVQNFHINKIVSSPPQYAIIVNFYPHIQPHLDVAVLKHAIEHATNYQRLVDTQQCPATNICSKLYTLDIIPPNPSACETEITVYAHFSVFGTS